ncbi:hypothetical protein D3C73_1453190 [compost metagenome]
MVVMGFSCPSTVRVSKAVNSSENGMGTAFAPSVLKTPNAIWFCMTRSLMPCMSSARTIGCLELVMLRKPFSQ